MIPKFSRRTFLQLSACLSGSIILTGCDLLEGEAETAVTDYDNHYVYENGRLLSDRQLRELESQLETLLELVTEVDANADADMPLQQAIDIALAEMELTADDVRRLQYGINSAIEHEFAADVREMSLFEWNYGEEFGGDDVIFPQGYDQIVNWLAEGLTIDLSHVVEKIAYDDNGVTITTNQGEFTADRAVVTLPLGVLQRGSVTFDPPLPEAKTAVMQSLGMGVLNKVYFQFDAPFWDVEADLIGNIADKKGVWAEFLNIAKYTGQPVLLGFNAGEYGRFNETLSDEEIIADGMAALRSIYGSDIPEPTGWQITRWAAAPFAYGSYSFLQSRANGDTYEGMGGDVNGRLFFAGEATSRDYPSTIHGAYLSGQREARRIAEWSE